MVGCLYSNGSHNPLMLFHSALRRSHSPSSRKEKRPKEKKKSSGKKRSKEEEEDIRQANELRAKLGLKPLRD